MTCILVACSCSRQTHPAQAQVGETVQPQQGTEQPPRGPSVPVRIQQLADKYGLVPTAGSGAIDRERPTWGDKWMLTFPHDSKRAKMDEFLQEWRAEKSVDDLIAETASDDPFCRARAAGRLGYAARDNTRREELQRAVPALIALLDDDTPLDITYINPLWAPIPTSAHTPGQEAASALQAIRPTDPSVLLAAVDDATSPHALRNLAATLAYFPQNEGLIQRLLRLLEHGDGRVRATAAGSLAHLIREQAIDPITRIKPSSAVEAMEFARVLIRIDTQRSRDAVLTMLADGSDDVRWGAAESVCERLFNTGGEVDAAWRARTLDALVTLMVEDPSETIRYRIASLMRYNTAGDECVTEALIQAALGDSSPTVRLSATKSLRYPGLAFPERRVDAVLKLLQAPEADIRAAAAATASAMLTEDRTAVGRQRLAPLKQALAVAFADPEGRVREAAAAGVGWHADDTAIEMLTEALISDPHDRTRWAAGEALAKVDGVGLDVIRRLDAAILDDQSKARENSCLLTAIWGITGIEGVNYPDRLDWWLKHRAEYLK